MTQQPLTKIIHPKVTVSSQNKAILSIPDQGTLTRKCQNRVPHVSCVSSLVYSLCVKMFRNLKLPVALFPLSLSKTILFLVHCRHSVCNVTWKWFIQKFYQQKKRLRMNSKTRGFSLKFLTGFYLSWLLVHNSNA